MPSTSVLLLAISVAVILSYRATASPGRRELPGDGPECVKQAAEQAMEKELQCLLDYKVEVVEMDEDDYYLRSSPKPDTVALPPKRRTYQLHANPSLCNTSFGPPADALYSIVMHELNHILDYTQMSQSQLTLFGLTYATNYSFLIWYEHRTDYKVLELGYGDGLKQYRNWIYGTLDDSGTPGSVCTKHLEYYTPTQIDKYQVTTPWFYINPCPPLYTFFDDYPSDCFGNCHYGTNCTA